MSSASCSTKRPWKSPPRKSSNSPRIRGDPASRKPDPKFHFATAFDQLPWPHYFVFSLGGDRMRAILLAVVAIQIGLMPSARAEDFTAPAQPIGETLPLFGKNHCESVGDSADVLFCGDSALNDAAAKLNVAIQERLNRLPDRRLAIEENAEWILDRNSSCGILRGQNVADKDLEAVKACLLKETEERTAILADPNFDCLASNTAAGTLICSDPDLAIAESELNGHVLGLIAKLTEDDAREAFAEYARWTRTRDRRCNLADKDNVPLQELPPSSAMCLSEYLNETITEIAAAKGNPKKVFGQHLPLPEPNADAVDACVAQIHAANACDNFLRVSRVFQIDNEVADQSALVTAEVEMIVLSPFAVCSPIASSCTGTCWDVKSGKANPSPGNRDRLAVSHKLRVEKSFVFQKTDNGSWRCDTTALQPVDFGTALGGP
jgi:uncharacterized protein YecT (DUF1311 family)